MAAALEEEKEDGRGGSGENEEKVVATPSHLEMMECLALVLPGHDVCWETSKSVVCNSVKVDYRGW